MYFKHFTQCLAQNKLSINDCPYFIRKPTTSNFFLLAIVVQWQRNVNSKSMAAKKKKKKKQGVGYETKNSVFVIQRKMNHLNI